ncbi:MAG: aminopeptidase P family protein [bacterium]|nr:aminopeptidase P family protein [bacterium]
MFEANVYVERRKKLREQMKTGVLLFPGNDESSMNYPANTYHYRQDSDFLYFFGLDKPGFFGLIDVDEDKDYIFGEDFTVDDIIWMGPQPKVKDLGISVGVEETGTNAQLGEKVAAAIGDGRKCHYLPPYRAENTLKLEGLLGIQHSSIKKYVSMDLIKAVVEQRSVKSDEEVAQIEKALEISHEMYAAIMKMAQPGIYEREIVGAMEGIVASYASMTSFPTILSINGETLHNHYHGNKLVEDKMLVVDSGAESPEHYASDITRTFPVGGVFNEKQKAVYQGVLKANIAAIEGIKPGVTFKELHLKAATIIAENLKELGLMKGDINAAVKEGAHALFFPHGLGHMIGLDVHDMESLGENNVGYDHTVERSSQFGLAYLRMARELKAGFVVTVEPGTYFVPALIEQWKAENKFSQYINYDEVEKYKCIGGIRIEDDVLVTETGFRVLGKPIPKSIEDIEKAMSV